MAQKQDKKLTGEKCGVKKTAAPAKGRAEAGTDCPAVSTGES